MLINKMSKIKKAKAKKNTRKDRLTDTQKDWNEKVEAEADAEKSEKELEALA